MIDLNKVPDEFESSYMVDLNEVPAMDSSFFNFQRYYSQPDIMADIPDFSGNSHILKAIPKIFRDYITHIQNPGADGNCGFRAVAMCLGLSENDYYQIRMELLNELCDHYSEYEEIYGPDMARLQHTLYLEEPGSVLPDKYMIMPLTGLLIASRFNIVLIFLSERECALCLPLWSSPPQSQRHTTGAIVLVGNHYVKVELQDNSPLPPNHPQWFRYKHDPAWALPYISRQNLYNELLYSNRNNV